MVVRSRSALGMQRERRAELGREGWKGFSSKRQAKAGRGTHGQYAILNPGTHPAYIVMVLPPWFCDFVVRHVHYTYMSCATWNVCTSSLEAREARDATVHGK